jgi:hypothetical protein
MRLFILSALLHHRNYDDGIRSHSLPNANERTSDLH